MKAKIVLVFAVLLSLPVFLTVVLSLDYPTKPIELLVPYTAGASIDILDRLIADVASTYLPQPIVVINRPGAGGSLAAAEVIAARPDGYKLVSQGNMFFATTVKTQKIPFNPDDLVPLANFMEWRIGLVVRGDAPWQTLNDLLDYCRKNPGRVTWGHVGRGTPPHLAALLIFRKAGVQATDVPFKGSSECITALLGGHVDAVSSPYGSAVEQVRAGLAKFLVYYTDRRYDDQPNIPTAAELGYNDAARLTTYVALYCHKNTPENIKQYLMAAFKKIYEDPRLKKGIEQLGEVPRFGGPDFVREKIKKGEEVGVPILKELGLYTGK